MNKGRRYAVLIGSSRFDKEPNLNSLKCPENDVDGRSCRFAVRSRITAGDCYGLVGFRVVVAASTLSGRSRRNGFRRASVRESRAYSGDAGDRIRK
jgi:hypothetical protein